MKKTFNCAIVQGSYRFAQPFKRRKTAEKALLDMKERESSWADEVRLSYVDGILVRLSVVYGVHCWNYDIKSFEDLINYKHYYPHLFQ